MRNRADEIRRQLAARGRLKTRKPDRKEERLPAYWFGDETEENQNYTYIADPPEPHPLFKKEWMMMKILGAAILVLGSAIIFKNPSPAFETSREMIEKTMEQEFQFAAVSDWYEEKFGKPLALLPEQPKSEQVDQNLHPQEYALPASGRIIEDFASNGQGVMIEIAKDESVSAMNEGIVVFAGKKEELGETVIIQHPDKSESWYGHLSEITVRQYDSVDAGKELGQAKTQTDGDAGEFYFAIKQGQDFIDPIQVITFE
ncbi:MAG TPA: M23 family metallopeptidase [Chondromyces sp.]|nr:M23 family metallopeptidase [Chondromyces sp.]